MDIGADAGTLALSGDFDVRSTGRVRAALHEQLAEHEVLVVDLSAVTSADLTALKVLAAASRRARRMNHRLVLRGVQPAVLRMLHLSHLIRLVELDREPVGV